MKLLKYLLLPLSILVIVYMIFLPACSKDDDIKLRYDSQLLISWTGFAFNCPLRIDKPPSCPNPEESPESCPCLYITSFSVTVSNFLMRRVFEDSSVGEEFDFYQGRSYQFDITAATEDNPFVTPDFAAKLDPSWYEIMSLQLDDFQIEVSGYPELTQQLNDDLHASITLPWTIVPVESRPDYFDPYIKRKIPLQEGWTRNLHLFFSCLDSIKVRVLTCEWVEVEPGIFEYQFTYTYTLAPTVQIVALSAG